MRERTSGERWSLDGYTREPMGRLPIDLVPTAAARKLVSPTLGGEPDKLGVRSHAGLGLYEIVVILNGLDADVEI